MKSLLVLSFLLASCACWQPETRNTPACLVLHDVIDCTEAQLIGLGPVALAIIQQYVNGVQNPDWVMVEMRLEAAGLKDGGCILAQLENNFITNAKVMAPGPELEAHQAKASSFHNFFIGWKTRHHLADVKFRIKLASGEEVLR